ncbi:MAG: hypothetical protein PHQ86_07975, partial [Dehalococcoidales bacterium]|nr:hypothetical protein [Dehalococcoidales bacterium]
NEVGLMRIFRVVRTHDESKVSGTGHVVDGVVFDDGITVIRWRTERPSVAIYASFEDFQKIHIDSHPMNETIVDTFDVDTTQWR